MAIQLIKIRCLECGANLSVEEGRQTVFCTYCGAKMMIANDNEHIYRLIDEARIKQAETDRIVRLRELDLEEKTSVSKKFLTIVWLVVSITLVGFGFVASALGNDGIGLTGIISGLNVAMFGGLALLPGKNKKRD